MLQSEVRDGKLVLFPVGKIDTGNAAQFQADAEEIIEKDPGLPIVIDADDLRYISSAGLRVLLTLMKRGLNLSVINADSTLYEIFETTGFSEMMEVSKAYKKLSIDGLEVIGRGSNGLVYRVDEETIVKVYKNPDSLPDILNERRLARYAFVHGIPTAISYDIVRVGSTYGSVFELLNAASLSKLITENPNKLKEYVADFVDLLRVIHAQEAVPGEVPSVKRTYIGYAQFLKEYLPEKTYIKLCDLISNIPEDCHLVHGDYYTNNVMIQNGEALLIDLDTLSCGHPIFEFGSTFNAYRGFFSIYGYGDSSGRVADENADVIWTEVLRQYYDGMSEEELKQQNDRAAILGYTRVLRRHIRRIGMDDEKTLGEYNKCRDLLIDLVSRIDSLC